MTCLATPTIHSDLTGHSLFKGTGTASIVWAFSLNPLMYHFSDFSAKLTQVVPPISGFKSPQIRIDLARQRRSKKG